MRMMRRVQNEKSGFTLVASIMASLVLGIIMFVSFTRAASHMGFLRSSQDGKDALYAASTGLETALAELRKDINWSGHAAGDFTSIEETVNGVDKNFGEYNVLIDTGNIIFSQNGIWQLIPAVITGHNSAQNSTHQAIRQIDVLIRAQSPAAFFISSLGNLSIQPGANIGSNILGLDIAFGPATENSPININNDGDVIYLRNVSGENNQYIYFNGPDGGGEVKKGEPVTFVGVDRNRYVQEAQNGFYHNGDLTIANASLDRTNYLFNGTHTAPNGVVYATGDVHISVQEVAESMVIVAEENIYITGDIKYNTSDPLIQLGLFAKGDIIIEDPGGDRTVQAFLISEGELKAEGGYHQNGIFDFYGAMAIRGKANNPNSAINLTTFQDRQYAYHSALFTNSTIPSMSFIADVAQWSIVGDPADLVN